MSDPLLVDIADGVATLTFNRPEARNAMSLDMRAAFIEATLRVERDDAVRCVVLKGAGDHFMAGGDVKRFHRGLDDDDDTRYESFLHGIQDTHRSIASLRRMAKPVLASVQGAAAGLGMGLVMAADLAVAAEDAFFTLAYVKLGTSPDGGSSFFLPRMVGHKRAAEIAMLGDRIDVATAKDFGIINWIVPRATLGDQTDRIAARLAAGPTRAYAATKQLLARSGLNTLETQLQLEAETFAGCAVSEDFKEGVRAFVDKRSPDFEGR